MVQRASLVGFQRPQSTERIIRRPIDIGQFDALKANVPANAKVYAEDLATIMRRLGH